MEAPPPPDYLPISPSEYPRIPTRMPAATLEAMRILCARGDIESFSHNIDLQSSSADDSGICNFYLIMVETIERDEAQFIQELLNRGLTTNSAHVSLAVQRKAKRALEAFIQSGWDINQPISELKPPVLTYAVADEEMTTWPT